MELDKKVLILGTMSAGKSTLINAIIGYDIFPSTNEACTAKIMTYSSDNNLKNIKGIFYGDYIKTYENLTKKDIDLSNKYNELKRVDLYGPINNINKDIHIKLIDTPGVNNSQNSNHQKITYEALEKEEFDTILYILNATQIGINDDALLLVKLRDYIEKNYSKDIIFVLNKIDEIDVEKESLEEIYKNTKRYISKNINMSNPSIIFTSAYYANLIKKQRNHNYMTKKELRDIALFIRDEEDYNKFNNLIQLKENSIINSDNLLSKTGILNLENYLFDGINREKEYIILYQKLLKIKSLTKLKLYDKNILKNILRELKNNNLLTNEKKPLRCYLISISKLNDKEAEVLKEILQDYNDSKIISLIIKSLNHSSNIYSKNDTSQDFPKTIHIDKNTNSLEILNSIIKDLLSIKQSNEKSYKKNLIKINIIKDMIIEKDEVIKFDGKIVNMNADINIKGRLIFNNCTLNIKYKTINLLSDNSNLQINKSNINLYKNNKRNIIMENKSQVIIDNCTINTFINTLYDNYDSSFIDRKSRLSKLTLKNCTFYKYKDTCF